IGGLTIDRRRGGGNYLLDAVTYRRVQNIECAIDENSHSLPGGFRTTRYAERGLMKYVVSSFDKIVDQLLIANIAFRYLDPLCLESLRQVAHIAADKVVQHAYLGRSCVEQLVYDRAADKAGATG